MTCVFDTSLSLSLFCTYTYIEVFVDVLKDKDVKTRTNLIFHIKNSRHGGELSQKIEVFYGFPRYPKYIPSTKSLGTQ